MNGFLRQSLKTRFFLVTALVLLGTCAGLYLLIDRIFLSYLQSEMQKQARELAEGLEDQLYNFVDPLHAQVTAERLLRERREISRIAVYRRVGLEMQRFISAEAVELPSDLNFYRMALNTRTMMRLEFTHKNTEYWEFIYPVIENNSVVGLITITLNFSQYRAIHVRRAESDLADSYCRSHRHVDRRECLYRNSASVVPWPKS